MMEDMHWDVVHMLHRRWGIPTHEAEDVAQDAVVTALEKGQLTRQMVFGVAKHKAQQRGARHVRDQRALELALPVLLPTHSIAKGDLKGANHRMHLIESDGDTFLVEHHEFTCRVCGAHETVKNGARGTVRCAPCRRRTNAEAYQRRKAA